MILLPCPVRPDLDCIAGALAYAEYLQRAKNTPAKAWLCGVPDGEAVFYMDLFKDHIHFATNEEIAKGNAYILVDFSTVDFLKEPLDRNKVIEVIDHRFFHDPQTEFPNARVQLDKIGASATQIAEFFIKDDLLPSEPMAIMLYGAIYTHTLCTKGELYTERDAAALQWLKKNFDAVDHYVDAQLNARKNEVLASSPDIFGTEMKMETAAYGRYGISQMELIDATSFWNEQKDAITAFFQKYDHPVCLNFIDLSDNSSTFYYSDPIIGNLLRNHVTVLSEEENAFRYSPALMRKQIIPVLKAL